MFWIFFPGQPGPAWLGKIEVFFRFCSYIFEILSCCSLQHWVQLELFSLCCRRKHFLTFFLFSLTPGPKERIVAKALFIIIKCPLWNNRLFPVFLHRCPLDNSQYIHRFQTCITIMEFQARLFLSVRGSCYFINFENVLLKKWNKIECFRFVMFQELY